VVRAEIRKAAAARRTTVPLPAPAANTPLTETERGLLWAIVHEPEQATAALLSLQDIDLEGLASQSLLRAARDVTLEGPGMLPSALMARLSDREARMLAKAGAERQAPVLDLTACVEALGKARTRRELADLDREIAQLAASDTGSARLTELVMKKIAIRRQLGER
jgi:hypothetical protein